MCKRLTYLIKNFGKVNSMVSFPKKNKLQALNINQLKLEGHDTYKKDEKITTNFETANKENVINNAYLNDKLKKNRWTFIVSRKRLQRV